MAKNLSLSPSTTYNIIHSSLCYCVSVIQTIILTSGNNLSKLLVKGDKELEEWVNVPLNEAVDDVKVKAVNEMMERIKHGVVLRPVKGQDTKVKLSVHYCCCCC